MSKKVNRLRGRVRAAEDALRRAEAERVYMLSKMARLQQIADNAVNKAEEKLKGACCFVATQAAPMERRMALHIQFAVDRYVVARLSNNGFRDMQNLARDAADDVSREVARMVLDEGEKMFERRPF